MATSNLDLLASYWTIAGDVCPFASNEASPHDFRARVVAAANAGYRGIGLNHDDLVVVLSSYGVKEAKSILADHGSATIAFLAEDSIRRIERSKLVLVPAVDPDIGSDPELSLGVLGQGIDWSVQGGMLGDNELALAVRTRKAFACSYPDHSL